MKKKKLVRQLAELFVAFHPDLTRKEQTKATWLVLLLLLLCLSGLIGWLALIVSLVSSE